MVAAHVEGPVLPSAGAVLALHYGCSLYYVRLLVTDEERPPIFPAKGPGNPRWSWPATEPLFGPDAEADLQAIADQNYRQALRLVAACKQLLRTRPSKRAVLIPDPPGMGRPRYLVDLQEGYCVSYYVLEPPADRRGAGRAVWIERVVTRASAEQALVDHESG